MDNMVNPQLRALLGPPIQQAESPSAAAAASNAAAPEGGPSFGEVLKDSIDQVNRLQMEADQAVAQLATGERADFHGTMIALQKADLSFKVMMEVRNKILSAYQELMRVGS